MVIAFFPGKAAADSAASQVKDWDKATQGVELGAMSVMYMDGDKVKTENLGHRKTGKGGMWGMIAGGLLGILSGGLTLIGGALLGAAGGGFFGWLKKTGVPVTDEQLQKFDKALTEGKAALVVMCDEAELQATEALLKRLGGDTHPFVVPADAMVALENAGKDAAKAAEEAVDATAKAVGKAADATGDAAKAVVAGGADSVAKAADAAADAVGKSADAAAKAVGDAADATKKAVS
jgi:hypothetical protein